MNIINLKPGDIVEHKLSKDWLMVLNIISEDTVECRMKNLIIEDFKDFELQPCRNNL